ACMTRWLWKSPKRSCSGAGGLWTGVLEPMHTRSTPGGPGMGEAPRRGRGVVARRVLADAHQLDALQTEHAVRLRPAPVVADEHADGAAERRVHGKAEVAGLEVALLEVLEPPPRLVLTMAGEVDLAVPAYLGAVGTHEHRRVEPV